MLGHSTVECLQLGIGRVSVPPWFTTAGYVRPALYSQSVGLGRARPRFRDRFTQCFCGLLIGRVSIVLALNLALSFGIALALALG